jgi:PhnB protein
MAVINPYLIFDGNAEEAFNFYKSVFGGEFTQIMRFGSMPGCEEMGVREDEKDRIMHVALPIGTKGDVLMASDFIAASGQKYEKGKDSGFSISIGADSKEEADQLFSALAEGGQTVMPMADAFWGDYFGMLKDKFGIDWMISYNPKYVTE